MVEHELPKLDTWVRFPSPAHLKQKRRHICPLCKKPVTWEGNPCRPFCSERCKTIDLGDWASERYRIPDREVENADELGDDEG